MIRIGLLGLGEAAQLLHLPALFDLRDKYTVTAVSDISKTLTDTIADNFNIPHRFYDPMELIESDTVDAVLILTPNTYHVAQAKRALQTGKHVFLEKPAAVYRAQLEDLLAEHEKYPDLVGMVGYVRRYADPFVKMKELLNESRARRPITYVRARTIVNENGFYTNQARPVMRGSDLPPAALEEGRRLEAEQMEKALGKGYTESQKLTYILLTCSGCHILNAVKELIGLPKAVKTVATANQGAHIVVTFDYGDFMCTFEEVNDQAIVQFDESIEIYQNDRRMHLKYDTPYVRGLPHQLEVVDSTLWETGSHIYGPSYVDMFVRELSTFYDCIQNKTQPKTDFRDSLADIDLYREIALMA